MILFYIKKNFFDGWDNILWIIANNVIAMAFVVLTYFGMSFIVNNIHDSPIFAFGISTVILIAGIFFLFTHLFSVSNACYKIADFKFVSYKEVFTGYKDTWKNAIIFALFTGIIISLSVIGIPFYLNAMDNLIGLFFAAFIFWVLLITLLALQWFVPLQSAMKGNFRKTLKKCFILLMDNFGFSVFNGLYLLVLTVISIFVAFLLPGLAGIALAQNNALRLRLYKYDWLEEHPEINPKQARKEIPWDELLAEDKESIGPRTLKSFIFPWK